MFKCICRREFEKELSLYAHQSHCKDYLGEDKYKARLEKSKASGQKGHNIAMAQYEEQRRTKLERWISEKHSCKRCGKVMTEKFGSGIYCSRQCSNSHPRTEETSQRPPVPKRPPAEDLVCDLCGKICRGERVLQRHIDKHNAKAVIGTTYLGNRVVLNITSWELEQYRKSHPVCEMCGKPETRKGAKNLCIDHDHETGEFRGLLCFKCNTNLGNYENNRSIYEDYLQRKAR